MKERVRNYVDWNEDAMLHGVALFSGRVLKICPEDWLHTSYLNDVTQSKSIQMIKSITRYNATIELK